MTAQPAEPVDTFRQVVDLNETIGTDLTVTIDDDGDVHVETYALNETLSASKAAEVGQALTAAAKAAGWSPES
jgi:hypothetical protein